MQAFSHNLVGTSNTLGTSKMSSPIPGRKLLQNVSQTRSYSHILVAVVPIGSKDFKQQADHVTWEQTLIHNLRRCLIDG